MQGRYVDGGCDNGDGDDKAKLREGYVRLWTEDETGLGHVLFLALGSEESR